MFDMLSTAIATIMVAATTVAFATVAEMATQKAYCRTDNYGCY